MPIFAAHYTYTAATAAGRAQHRPAHRDWLRGLFAQGILLSCGPYPDGSGALILVLADDLSAAEKLMPGDPFARGGVVNEIRVVEWQPVLGTFAP